MRSGRPPAPAKASRLVVPPISASRMSVISPTQHYLKRAATGRESAQRPTILTANAFPLTIFPVISAGIRHEFSRCARRAPAPRHSAVPRPPQSAPAPASLTGPEGASNVMRRRCGCRDSNSQSLTLAKAMSAASSFCISGSTSRRANTAATLPSVCGAVGDARGIGGEFRIAAERGIAQNLFGQNFPFAIILDRNQNVGAVLAPEHAVGRDRRMREPDALERLSAFVREQRHRHPFRHGVEQRD